MRLTREQLQAVMKKYNVGKLYSWSKVNCFMISPYEYYLKYILHAKEDIDNCAYAPMGGICHQIIEDYYSDKIDYGTMLENFNDGWTTAIEIADLKFDRNDETKNENIREKYKYNLEHFFKTHNSLKGDGEIFLEMFMTTRIGSSVLQGYIDAIVKDKDENYTIIDWKTSSKYTGKTAEEKCGQLVVYALGLNQKGIPFDKIRICWNFLKYVTIQYQQKNGTIKTRDVERCKIGESLQSNVKTWLRYFGYDVDEYLKQLLDTNDISCLPDEVKEKYVISDCYIYVPITDKLIHTWTDTITATIKDIELREADYEKYKNSNLFWDSDESVKSQSYYFATLCGYSANLHAPYKCYLEKLDASKNGYDMFTIPLIPSDCTSKSNSVDKDDLSWLDSL